MGLFQRRENNTSHAALYRMGLQKTLLIVGLGNVGKQYADTRHNVGFAVLDTLAEKQDFPAWTDKKDLKSQITMSTQSDARVILCKPTTMMNLSGEAVQAVSYFYKVPVGNIVVVHDELDIEFGQIRTRIGGSSAGNNGIKSVTDYIGENYGRIRIGIGPKTPSQMDSADFVLAKFSSKEQNQMKNLLQESTAILTEYIYSGQLNAETRSFLV